MDIERIDHLVLSVRDVEATCAFYTRVLDMDVISFDEGSTRERKALAFGQQKLNLDQVGQEFEPKAMRPTPGAVDLCLVTRTPIEEVMAHLVTLSVAIELGPIARTGALGPMRSIYFRDPDGNLIEVASYEVTS